MSARGNAEPELAGEDAASSSEGLRPDTRTSNSEMWEGRAGASESNEQPASSGGQQQIPGLQQKIHQLQQLTAQPERREANRARKKLMKDVQHEVYETGRTDEDKISYLMQVLGDQMTLHSKLDKQLIPMRKSCDTANKERDAAVEEKTRVVELNNKLHELCRELRKENALLLDTSKAISAQELSQRKALTENFQETVEGITKRLEDHEKERMRIVHENENLKQKLRALCEQYEARDSHFNQQLQTKDLEIKMASVKLQEQAELVDRAEVQSKKLSEAFGQVQSHKLETDKLLESYNERFAECQHSIEKSNEVFKMLRTDGERKQQLLKQADKDRRTLNKQHQEMQLRLDQANARLVQLTDENNGLRKGSDDAEKTRLRAQNDRLQALCRSLRQESKGAKPEAELSTASSSDGTAVPPESSTQSKEQSDSNADIDGRDDASAPAAIDSIHSKVAPSATSDADGPDSTV